MSTIDKKRAGMNEDDLFTIIMLLLLFVAAFLGATM